MLSKTGKWVNLNGKLVHKEKAVISAFDRGYLYADSLLETMRVYFLKVPFLQEHFNRLESSMNYLGFVTKPDFAEFSYAVNSVVQKNIKHSCSVRYSISRGVGGEIAFGAGAGFVPQTLCFIRHISPALEQVYEDGIRVATSGCERGSESIRLHKTNCYTQAVVERHRARSQGFDDVLFFDVSGALCESATSNVFIVKNGCLATPGQESAILEGITRSKIIEVAKDLGIDCYQTRIDKESVLSADEIFLTNSVAEVIPVVERDSVMVGTGKPGVVTRKIHAAYRALIEEEIS